MAEKYIINMPLKSTPADTDWMIIEDAQDTKKITFANLVKPTKDIADSGSNDNGSYIKFADGTMICTHRLTLNYGSTSQLSETWTFPASFSSRPVVLHIINLTGRSIAPVLGNLSSNKVGGVSTSGVALLINRVPGTEDFTTSDYINTEAIAIGGWK